MAIRADPAWCSTAVRDLVGGPARRAHVVASGDRAAYLRVDGEPGRIVAVVALRGVALPLSVRVGRLPALIPGAGGTVGGDGITVAGATWWAAGWWDPRPSLDPHAVADAALRLLPLVEREPANTFGVPRWLGVNAAAALGRGDPRAALRLLGRGPGFTPAGDDVIAGALAGLALSNRLNRDASRALIAHVAERTTTLSAALIACAARGQVIPAVADLLTAAIHHDAERMSDAARAVFAVGSTSGHAMCLGLTAALSGTTKTSLELT